MYQRFPRAAAKSTWFTTPSTAVGGVSKWHLLAVGVMQDTEAQEFVESTVEVPGRVLLDDLLEYVPIGIPSPYWWINGFDIFSAAWMPDYRGLSLEEICRGDGCTLLSHYWCVGSRRWKMHPIVRGYEEWITREVEKDWGFILPKLG